MKLVKEEPIQEEFAEEVHVEDIVGEEDEDEEDFDDEEEDFEEDMPFVVFDTDSIVESINRVESDLARQTKAIEKLCKVLFKMVSQ